MPLGYASVVRPGGLWAPRVMRRTRVRAGTTAMVCAFGLAGASIATAPASSAAPVPLAAGRHQCSFQDSQNGKTYRWVTLDHKRNVITHAVKRRVEKGTIFDRSVTKSTTTVVRASVSAGVRSSAEANTFFAKASIELSVNVASDHEHTTSQSVTDHYTIPAKPHARNFVFYDGVKYFNLTWHRRHCGLPYGSITRSGDLRTYNRAEFGGNVLCPHSRYKRGSEPYVATIAGGC
jgi:hypothetical protein